MDFWQWLFFELLGDTFTVVTFGVLAICLSVIVRDGIKYGWTYEEDAK